MRINKDKIDSLILEIKTLQQRCIDTETMFIYNALDKALKKIGWIYADLLYAHEEAK